MKSFVLILFSTLSGLSMGCSQEKDKIQIVGTDVYKEVVKNAKHNIIDVRTPGEFEAGHLAGATNIDFFDQSNFFEAYDDYDRKEPIYLYCQSGNRSLKVADKLVEMGFEHIYDMQGGYIQWEIDQN